MVLRDNSFQSDYMQSIMRLLSYLFTLLVTVMLTSCGGGGGSAGIPVTGTNARALSVAAPSGVTLAPGLTQQYTISGGVKPYTVFSSNPAVATGWLIGEDVFAVGAVAPGTSVVSVRDSTNARFDQAVTVGSTTAFFTNAPSSLNITPGPFASQTYKLGGGIPPYKAVSSNPSVLSVVVNGTDVTITALQMATDGSSGATITYSDSSNPVLSTTTTVTMKSLPLTLSLDTVTMPIGTSTDVVVTGGTPPYHTVVLANGECASVQFISGNVFRMTAKQLCSGNFVVGVFDANNLRSPTMSVTFTAATFGLFISPSSLTLPETASSPNLTLSVFGAAPGASLQVFSSNTAIFTPQTPVQNSDGTWTITLTGGNVCSLPVAPATLTTPATGGDRIITITVLDSAGRVGTSTLTVKDTNAIGGC